MKWPALVASVTLGRGGEAGGLRAPGRGLAGHFRLAGRARGLVAAGAPATGFLPGPRGGLAAVDDGSGSLREPGPPRVIRSESSMPDFIVRLKQAPQSI
jgi:hypothetical protein